MVSGKHPLCTESYEQQERRDRKEGNRLLVRMKDGMGVVDPPPMIVFYEKYTVVLARVVKMFRRWLLAPLPPDIV